MDGEAGIASIDMYYWFSARFLPEGIIGYGLAGTLIGGDRTHAVAISTELFVFFWGVFCAKKKQNTFLEKKR